MIMLKAPYPNFVHTLILPNPKLGDSYTLVREVDVKRSLNGTPFTYVKTSNSIRLIYQIEITRAKSLELKDFFSLYGGTRLLLTDHNSISYIAVCNSEINFQNFKRAWYSPDDAKGSSESLIVDLEFEGQPI